MRELENLDAFGLSGFKSHATDMCMGESSKIKDFWDPRNSLNFYGSPSGGALSFLKFPKTLEIKHYIGSISKSFLNRWHLSDLVLE